MTIQRSLPPPPDRLKPDISLFIVNIVLLLILFFLATGQIMNGAPADKRLAITHDLPLDLLPQPLLEIGASGVLSLNSEPVTGDDLDGLLVGETDLYVLVDGAIDAVRLVEILARDDLAAFNVELVTIANRSGNGAGQ